MRKMIHTKYFELFLSSPYKEIQIGGGKNRQILWEIFLKKTLNLRHAWNSFFQLSLQMFSLLIMLALFSSLKFAFKINARNAAKIIKKNLIIVLL